MGAVVKKKDKHVFDQGYSFRNQFSQITEHLQKHLIYLGPAKTGPCGNIKI